MIAGDNVNPKDAEFIEAGMRNWEKGSGIFECGTRKKEGISI